MLSATSLPVLTAIDQIAKENSFSHLFINSVNYRWTLRNANTDVLKKKKKIRKDVPKGTSFFYIAVNYDYLIPSFLRISLGIAFLCTTMFMVL